MQEQGIIKAFGNLLGDIRLSWTRVIMSDVQVKFL